MQNIRFTKEDGIASSVEPVFLPPLNAAAEVWVYSESSRYADFSPRQRQIFADFLALPDQRVALGEEMAALYREQIRVGRIVPRASERPEPAYTACIVPAHGRCADDYLYIIGETNWRIAESDCCFETEYLFVNNRLAAVGEMSGDYALFPPAAE
ncbi:hypothetical protein ACG2K1_04585 [Neisseria sp. 23W00296]|uniref:hypothetical protein n=1 Tax=unclassified Neisseria TaxID=2623750 RepID=UPI003756EA17